MSWKCSFAGSEARSCELIANHDFALRNPRKYASLIFVRQTGQLHLSLGEEDSCCIASQACSLAIIVKFFVFDIVFNTADRWLLLFSLQLSPHIESATSLVLSGRALIFFLTVGSPTDHTKLPICPFPL